MNGAIVTISVISLLVSLIFIVFAITFLFWGRKYFQEKIQTDKEEREFFTRTNLESKTRSIREIRQLKEQLETKDDQVEEKELDNARPIERIAANHKSVWYFNMNEKVKIIKTGNNKIKAYCTGVKNFDKIKKIKWELFEDNKKDAVATQIVPNDKPSAMSPPFNYDYKIGKVYHVKANLYTDISDEGFGEEFQITNVDNNSSEPIFWKD